MGCFLDFAPIEEELQVAQAAEETEAESLQELAEKEIVGKWNLISSSNI